MSARADTPQRKRALRMAAAAARQARQAREQGKPAGMDLPELETWQKEFVKPQVRSELAVRQPREELAHPATEARIATVVPWKEDSEKREKQLAERAAKPLVALEILSDVAEERAAAGKRSRDASREGSDAEEEPVFRGGALHGLDVPDYPLCIGELKREYWASFVRWAVEKNSKEFTLPEALVEKNATCVSAWRQACNYYLHKSRLPEDLPRYPSANRDLQHDVGVIYKLWAKQCMRHWCRP
jgi:hypothetical protein